MFNFFFIVLPDVFPWIILATAAFFYFYLHPSQQDPIYTKLAWTMGGFRVFFALAVTVGQYYVWSSDAFTRLLIDSPAGGVVHYFLPYAWSRYWLNVVLAIFFAWLFWMFLKILKRYRNRFFEKGEVILGLLCAIVVGWPYFIPFLITVFFAVILISLFRGIFLKEPFTTLGGPFLLATLIILIFGVPLLHALGMDVLRI